MMIAGASVAVARKSSRGGGVQPLGDIEEDRWAQQVAVCTHPGGRLRWRLDDFRASGPREDRTRDAEDEDA
jgi:hypothetical protein